MRSVLLLFSRHFPEAQRDRVTVRTARQLTAAAGQTLQMLLFQLNRLPIVKWCQVLREITEWLGENRWAHNWRHHETDKVGATPGRRAAERQGGEGTRPRVLPALAWRTGQALYSWQQRGKEGPRSRFREDHEWRHRSRKTGILSTQNVGQMEQQGSIKSLKPNEGSLPCQTEVAAPCKTVRNLKKANLAVACEEDWTGKRKKYGNTTPPGIQEEWSREKGQARV